MSELFNNYNRPKSELKIIAKFLNSFKNAQSYYKNKEYLKAIEELKISYNLLIDIWDEYPKIMTLYLMIKSFYYSRQYSNCLSLQDEIIKRIEIEEQRDKKIIKEKIDLFIKIKARVEVYKLIINFIFENLDTSVDLMLNMIKYLSESRNLSLEYKISYFFEYLKSFLKIVGIKKSAKFNLFKQDYESMVIIENNNNNTNNNLSQNNNDMNPPIKKIKKRMVDKYKSLMNSELRNNLYEMIDKEYYFVKYGKIDDRVMIFLQKNMNIYVRENNKVILIEKFNAFLDLGRINLKREYNMTMKEIIHIQKSRIEKFDIIFANLCGAFNHIFKDYFVNDINEDEISFSQIINERNKIRLSLSLMELKKEIKKAQSLSPSSKKYKNEENKKVALTSFNFNTINNVRIPPNTEDLDHKILLLKKIEQEKKAKSRTNIFIKNNSGFKLKLKNSITVKKFKLHKNNFIFTENSNFNDNKNMQRESDKFPLIINNLKLNPTRKIPNYDFNEIKNNIFKKKNIDFKNLILNTNYRTIDEDKKNYINKKEKFILRNINNTLITKLIDLYSLIYNFEHRSLLEEEEKEEISYSKIFPRKIDLDMNFDYPKIIKSYYSYSVKGTYSLENQDSFFYYEDFMLIKNLTLFGVCDGHGKNGQIISNKLCILFPAYLIYLLIDDTLLEEKKDINKEFFKLFKAQENPKEVKDMYILRYFFNKLNSDINNFALFTDNIQLLKNKLHEVCYYCHKDLQQRFGIDYEFSGSTLCCCFILGDILYIVNIGDSKMILGKFITNYNKWKPYSLSVAHSLELPSENARITAKGGRIERIRNKFGREVGPLRVFDNDFESNKPGLNMSRSIGDNFAKKLGVCYEPDITKYKIKKDDKIIIIATDGLYNILSNEEIVNIVGKFYADNKKPEEAALSLIENAKNKYNQKMIEKKKKMNESISRKNINSKRLNTESDIEKSISYLDDITCIIIFL